MTEENLSYCKGVREELNHYYDGDMYRCPKCGEKIYSPQEIPSAQLTCGCIIDDQEEVEQLGMYDYFDDYLDCTYYVGSSGDFMGTRILIAFGGPNVYIDTYRKSVELYWWSENASVGLFSEICESINEVFEEKYRSVCDARKAS